MERQTGMTLWLHIDTKGSFEASRQRINLDKRPAPTVNTGGFGVGNRFHHWRIEEDGKRQREDGVNDKPPYRVPSMAEIAALPWNGWNVVSTFSGCGGSCLGYRMAGFRVLWASEFVPAAQQAYKANHPNSILDTRDIRTIQPQEILNATGLNAGELDLLDGSPPCACFSTAGKREASWGKVKTYSDTKQRTDDLFFEYARILRGLQPTVFVAENVSGLVKGTAKGFFKEILRALKDCGYVVEARLLDAQWLGVPQMRQRIIFQGVRKDLGVQPAFPKPLPYRYSVRDALPWILKQGDNGGFGCGAMRDTGVPSPVIGTGPQTGNGRFPPSLVEADTDISRYAIGAEWEQLKSGEKSEKYLNLIRPDADLPCPTVTQTGSTRSAASVTHPTEKRKFSISELKRICAFPDDFILMGTYAQQWERLGRAVPPVMMCYIASTIRDQVLSQCVVSSERT
jgi:DNA (cytosine-5)-methyltransferase 1